MSSDAWSERRKSLEESFYHGHNQRLLDELRQKMTHEEERKALAAATGISDEAILQQLVEARINSQTLAAVGLIPVIAVGWADGSIDAKERTAILQACESVGIAPGTASYQLVENWLGEAPPADLLAAWKSYISLLTNELNDDALAHVRQAIVGRATKVAEAAGGFLGQNRISPVEQRTLDELEAALSKK